MSLRFGFDGVHLIIFDGCNVPKLIHHQLKLISIILVFHSDKRRYNTKYTDQFYFDGIPLINFVGHKVFKLVRHLLKLLLMILIFRSDKQRCNANQHVLIDFILNKSFAYILLLSVDIQVLGVFSILQHDHLSLVANQSFDLVLSRTKFYLLYAENLQVRPFFIFGPQMVGLLYSFFVGRFQPSSFFVFHFQELLLCNLFFVGV